MRSIVTDFKERRNKSKNKQKEEHRIEMLATLNAKYAIEGRCVNDVRDLETFQGEKEWNNAFIMKVLVTLTLTGLIAGLDVGAIAVFLLKSGVAHYGDDKNTVYFATFTAVASFGSAIGSILSGIF